MLLGSTTAKVLNDADCPVITTAHAEKTPRSLEHRNIICAIGLTADSERVLRFACRATFQIGANLLVVHAVHGNHNALPQLSDKEQLDSDKESDARRRLYELEKTACSAPVHIAVGKVKEVLVEVAQEFAADGIIIGRAPRSGVLGRIRDLTYSVIRDSPCPVLSV
jgi:nucleotide-binding universal stress UspA family protein